MSATGLKERRVHLQELGIHTRVLDAGQGPVVLMLHGNPDNADEWRPLIERLSGQFRCVAPDFPGYGQSPEPPESFDYGLEVQKRFVDAVLEDAGVDKPVVLVVHDTGGMVGTAWAAANIPRVKAVVFTNTAVFENFPWFPIAKTWGNASAFGRFRAEFGMTAIGLAGGLLFKRIFGRQSPQLSEADLNRFAASFAVNGDAKRTALRQFRRCVPTVFFAGFEALRRNLVESVPCRVLWGDDDPYLTRELASRFFSAPVKILPGVGHWVPLVAADALAAEVITASR
jgi:haloalkane dehalogenase